jgi:ABC-type lipoprotein export system ATPase subunit
MKITHYRITNFRSIVDTDWQRFSRDGVTVLVGQNESGKTSILDALATTFSTKSITADDLRSGAPLPQMQLKLQCPFEEIEPELTDYVSEQVRLLQTYWTEHGGNATIDFSWYDKTPATPDKSPFGCAPKLIDAEDLLANLSDATADEVAKTSPPASASVPDPNSPSVTDATPRTAKPETQAPKFLTAASIGQALWRAAPEFILFSERSGTLPNEIELDEKGIPTGNGAIAASNYLYAAQIDIAKMLKSERRTRESFMVRANAKLTEAFNSFWSQTIGKDTKLSLTCDIQFRDATDQARAGKPYLVFWISDRHTQLYPSQRSQGVRWFVSFFLQLKAAKSNYDSALFLLDEPGANLHSKAQGDVLRLINALRHEIPIVYSTHSPHLVEYEHLHRIHAVQRVGDDEDSPTTILDAHQLGAASSDTLSPILTAMGTDLASQQTIQRRDNVLLEEVSGFYYLSAFWKLTGEKQTAHFIASTGVNKLPALANMFLGWGLDFITVVDDDNQGRGVYKELMRDLYGDDAEIANRFVIKLKGYEGIEDIFSTSDFKRHVLKDENANIQQKNSEFLKRAGRSKPILALEFKLAIDNGHIRFLDLDEVTQSAIKEAVSNIAGKLAEPVAKAA